MLRARPFLLVVAFACGSLAGSMAGGDLDLGGVADAGADDDAVGDDDAAFASTGADAGGAQKNPYLSSTASTAPAAGGNGKGGRYANLQAFMDGSCKIKPATATHMVNKCLGIAEQHNPTTCALCVAPMLPRGCLGDAAVDFCVTLKKDAPAAGAGALARTPQLRGRSTHTAESKTKAAKNNKKTVAATPPSAHASASEHKLDRHCGTKIAHACAHSLSLPQHCVECALKLGAGPCSNRDEALYLCTRLAKQRAATVHKAHVKAKLAKMHAEHEMKGHIRRRRATMRRRRRLAGAASLAHDIGHTFDAKAGLAATENSHFRPRTGFSTAFGEIAACLLDRSQGVYDTFVTMATCGSFTHTKGWDCYASRASDLAQDIRFCCAGGEHLPTPKADARCRKAILPILKPIEEHVVPFYEHCVSHPGKCALFRKEFTQCLDMRDATKHIEGESFVCQQAMLKVFMPILKQAINGARQMFKGAPETDITKLAIKYMSICPEKKPVCDNVADLVKFQAQYDEAELNPWDN